MREADIEVWAMWLNNRNKKRSFVGRLVRLEIGNNTCINLGSGAPAIWSYIEYVYNV